MKPEVSLLYLQQPTTGPYPDPDESSLQLRKPFFLKFILILSS